jgi:hypothetical protein
MFLSISLPLSLNLTPSLSYHIVRKRIAKVTDFLSFCPFGISIFQFSLSELVCTKYVFYPILLFPLLSHPKLLPLWSVTDGQRKFFTPCYLSSFFFPLSARGPTRRRNSTGLAELWGGWPIELGKLLGSYRKKRQYFLQITT